MSNFFTIICETLSQPPWISSLLPSEVLLEALADIYTYTHTHTCWSFSFWFYGAGLLFNIPTLLWVCLVNRSNDRAMVAPSNVSLHELKPAQLSNLPFCRYWTPLPVSHSLVALRLMLHWGAAHCTGAQRHTWINAHPRRKKKNR